LAFRGGQGTRTEGRGIGPLELRYTARHCYSSFKETVSRHRYRVLASDATSVAIVADGEIHHIHFEGDSYWMTLGTSNMREFFRRVRHGGR
jgi:hypothetical protein